MTSHSRAAFWLGLAALVIVPAVLLYVLIHAEINVPAGRSATPPVTVAAALRQRLHRQSLVYQWVVCVKMHRRYYQGHVLSRCNVNFGEPHIVPYCALLLHGKLVTDRQNRAVDCGKRVRAEEADASVNVR